MLKLTEKINHSWAIKWYASAFVKGMYTLYPKKSYVRNIGNDGSGTNSEKIKKFFIKKLNTKKVNKKIKIQEDLKTREEFEKFFKTIYQKKTLLNKFIEQLRI